MRQARFVVALWSTGIRRVLFLCEHNNCANRVRPIVDTIILYMPELSSLRSLKEEKNPDLPCNALSLHFL